MFLLETNLEDCHTAMRCAAAFAGGTPATLSPAEGSLAHPIERRYNEPAPLILIGIVIPQRACLSPFTSFSAAIPTFLS
ncbi:MAG TPA: hypothetical protein VGW76_19315 [Pyrinomonadaceae bacterium]|nr:hypothetical protein [Pyrinomonadaceae bacterium]